MERWFENNRFQGEGETVSVKRNHTYVEQSSTSCPYVLPSIVYDHAYQRIRWLLTSRQTPRHKASSMNVLRSKPSPTTIDSSRNANVDEGEDERDEKSVRNNTNDE